MKTQQITATTKEAQDAAQLMERLVLKHKDQPNWPLIVATEYKRRCTASDH